jgi:hypothetical protein
MSHGGWAHNAPMLLLHSLALLVSFGAMAVQSQTPDPSASEMRFSLERFEADRSALGRKYAVPLSQIDHDRMRKFYSEWLESLAKQPFETMSHPGQVDYVLFDNYLRHSIKRLDQSAKREQEIKPILPFAPTIVGLEETWQRMDPVNPQLAATTVNDLIKQIGAAHAAVSKGMKVERTTANRAVAMLDRVRRSFGQWFTFYNGYDPLFGWWVSEPYKEANKALEEYTNLVRDKLVGIKPDDKTTIIGDPIGTAALQDELNDAMISYTPQEIIDIANKEFAWCEIEMKKASHEMGFGDDWKKALEKTKQDFVDPGKQPELIRSLFEEATKYVKDRDLVRCLIWQ